MATNDKVEVKISASTTDLDRGMSQAENRVKTAAANINSIADGIKNAFENVKKSLQNFDIKIDIDISKVETKLNQVKSTIRTQLNTVATDNAIKLRLDDSKLTADLSSTETLIRRRLSNLPTQKVSVKINFDNAKLQTDLHNIIDVIKSQLQTADTKVKIKLDIAELSNIKNKISTALGSNTIKVKFDRSNLQSELTQIRNRINSFFTGSIRAIPLKIAIAQTELTAARARLQSLTTTIFRAKVGIDLTYLNSQIAHARSMLSAGIANSLNINIDATSSALRSSLDHLKASIDSLRSRINNNGGGGGGGGSGGSGGGDSGLGMLAGIRGQLAGLMASYVGLSAVVNGFHKLISTQREFDILNAQLETATKSSENAKIAFAALQDFAKKTPYSLSQAVEGFTKLVNLGLTPSERALMSYGNTAASMGKDLMQFIEAVADASTSEFERLKEFGIKSKQEGNKVALTFQGTTKTIGNNAKEIEEYLIKIGENEFAGAMAKRVDTLDGAIAALGDTWDSLFRAISAMGVGDLIKTSVNNAESAITNLIDVIESGAIQAALSGASKAFSLFGSDAESDMKSIASAFSWLGDYLVESWRNTLNDINVAGNLFTITRSYIQKAAVGVAASVDVITDPFNKRTTNQQKQDNYNSSMADIDAQRDGRIDGVQKGYDEAIKKWDQFKAKQLKDSKKEKTDQLAQFKIKSTDNPSKGDDKKSKKAAAESKYEPTTYADLRVKSAEAYAGGKAHQGILDLASLIQDKFEITRFTAFNDKYHQGTKSNHAKGLALDFTLQDVTKSGKVSADLRAMLSKNGVNAQVLDEYKNPSKRATGGHIHVSFNSQTDADKYLALVKQDKVKGDKKSGSDSQYERFLADQQNKALELKYKYASEEEKIAIDLAKAKKAIDESINTSEKDRLAYKLKAEQEASEKLVQLKVKEFNERKPIDEEMIANAERIAQRQFDFEFAQLQSLASANKISHIERVAREKKLQDQLYQIKRDALIRQLDLENQSSAISGKQGNQSKILNQISDLDNQNSISDVKQSGLISDAQMKDFESKFGGLTNRISGLWDKGIQAMMNGTLTWKGAMNAIFTELAGAFIQSIITEPLRNYAASLATRMAMKLGFIKAETAAEVTGQTVQTGAVVAGETAKTAATSTGVFARLGLKLMEVIKSIMMSAWEAMAGAWAALSAIPIVGPALGVAAGIAAFAGVSAIAGKVASARGGYDIPAGVNPMTQLHEEEMVLPKQHANTIRALGKTMTNSSDMAGTATAGNGGDNYHFSLGFLDTKGADRWLKKNGKAVAESLKGYNRSFGK